MDFWYMHGMKKGPCMSTKAAGPSVFKCNMKAYTRFTAGYELIVVYNLEFLMLYYVGC